MKRETESGPDEIVYAAQHAQGALLGGCPLGRWNWQAVTVATVSTSLSLVRARGSVRWPRARRTSSITTKIGTVTLSFIARVGLSSIGYALSEPFWSTVKVNGQQKDVLIQAFQRRVLTYTPSNPAAFQVEFGNIGQHYYTWRYGG